MSLVLLPRYVACACDFRLVFCLCAFFFLRVAVRGTLRTNNGNLYRQQLRVHFDKLGSFIETHLSVGENVWYCGASSFFPTPLEQVKAAHGAAPAFGLNVEV